METTHASIRTLAGRRTREGKVGQAKHHSIGRSSVSSHDISDASLILARGRGLTPRAMLYTLGSTTEFPQNFCAPESFRTRVNPHQNRVFLLKHLHTIVKRKHNHELSQAEIRGILKAKSNTNDKSIRSIAKRYRYSKGTVRNAIERARDAEKENIDPFTPKALTA